MAITNKQLVAYAEAQLGRPYWYGTFGQTASPQLLKEKKKQYPDYYNQSKYKVKFTDQYGQRVHDCVGLIKGAVWSNGDPNATPKYNSAQDVSANGLIGKCVETGSIKAIPDVKGLIVWKDHHVGVYVGGGWVIEARGHDYGVVKTRVDERPWVSWGRLPSDFVKYEAEPAPQPAPAPAPTPAPTPAFKPYEVKITAEALNYRAGPGLNYKVNGIIQDKGGIYTIVDEAKDDRNQTWGKLKSGVGWISLKYTKKL